MTERSEQEINETLAKWAGTWPHSRVLPPPYTQSLDAQARDLWPKLRDMGGTIVLQIWSQSPTSANISLNGLIQQDHESPAMACALAIFALLKEEK